MNNTFSVIFSTNFMEFQFSHWIFGVSCISSTKEISIWLNFSIMNCLPFVSSSFVSFFNGQTPAYHGNNEIQLTQWAIICFVITNAWLFNRCCTRLDAPHIPISLHPECTRSRHHLHLNGKIIHISLIYCYLPRWSRRNIIVYLNCTENCFQVNHSNRSFEVSPSIR